MKKLILFLVVAGVLVGGFFLASKYARVQIGVLLGEIKTTTRGDLVVPITASGFIKPASVTQIKSKASGEVTDLPVGIGSMVKKGTLLVQLLDVDEKRNLDRAQSEYNRALIAKDQAELKLKQCKGPALDAAEAKIKRAEASLVKAKADFEFEKRLIEEDGVKNPLDFLDPEYRERFLAPSVKREEWIGYGAALHDAEASVLAAKADRDQAKLAIEGAEHEIRTAKENADSFKSAFDDAGQRYKETKIYAPSDGMILTRVIQIGEVVSSAKVSLTGGNLLMEMADVSEIYAVVNVDEADIGQVHVLAPVEARPGTATRPATQPARRPEAEAATQPATLPADTFDHGQVVKIKVESFSDEEFEGVITQISPQSEVVQAVATFKVWIRITSPNVKKLIGLLNTQAEAHFTAKSVRNAVLVKYDAVQRDPNGEGYGVYIPVPKPGSDLREPKFVKCEFGADNGIDIEVRKGLKEGQEVYVKLPLKRDDQK